MRETVGERSVGKALRPTYGVKIAVLLLAIVIPSTWNVTEASDHGVPIRITTDGGLQAISGNGRYVFDRQVQTSRIRRHDLETGQTLAFEFVSDSPVAVDHSGRLILYQPVQGDGRLYVYDVDTGTSELVTVTMDGSIPVTQSTSKMTTDGRFVVFSSRSSALVEGDTNDKWDVFIYDRVTGMTELVSVGLGGAPANDHSSNHSDHRLGVSDDGRFVIFQSLATNLTQDEMIEIDEHLFLRDRLAGVTRRLSQTNTGEEADRGVDAPAINREGTYALFVAGWSNLTNITSFCCSTIVVANLASGLRFQEVFGLNGAPPNGTIFIWSGHYQTPLFAGEGRFIVFTSNADNLVVGDASGLGANSLFALDRTAGTTSLLSVNDQGVQMRSGRFDVSADGRVVAFDARSLEQIVPDPLAGIYVLDRGDVHGPDVFGILSPTTAPLGDTFVLSAYADDSGDRGNNIVVSGDYRIDDGPWWPMEADDGAFDSPTEQMVAVVSTDMLGPGHHQICVRATDALGNTDFPTCVSIEILPPFSGLRVRCLHDPIWPQPGDTVTIIAEALHSSIDVLGTTPVTADIEIWFNDTGPVVESSEVESLAHEVFDIPGPATFTYSCRVAKEGSVAFSGWKLSSVGDPTGLLQGSVPIWKSASTSEAIDVSFAADAVTYFPDGAMNPQFLLDVREVIHTSYLDFDLFLRNQDKFNFWITPGSALAADADTDPFCSHALPTGYLTSAAFVDVFAILHRKGTRDCAPKFPRSFSGDMDRADGLEVIRHETGHTPFGLADEYCCDGGYFQRSKMPNVYRNQGNCEADAPNLGRTAADCRSWQGTTGPIFRTWWTSEPDGNDLMNDNRLPRAADIRRIFEVFRRCAEGKC